MKRFVVLLSAILWSLNVLAQIEVKPGSFKEVPGFVNVNPDPNYQTDDNDLPFAIIKVRTENITDKQRRDLRFEGNAGTFIVLEYKVGEVWVYLTAKYADYLKISHPDFSSIEITMPYDLKPKCGYELTLVNKWNNTKEEMVEYNYNKSAMKDIVVEKNGGIDKVHLVLEKETLASYAEAGYKFLTLNASVNQYSDLSYGITLGSMKKFGWFVSATTNFNFATNFDFECDAGHYVDGYYPEYTGTVRYSSLSVMGGVLMRLGGPVALRAGVGYGMRTKCYETNNGYWVKNSAISTQGLDASLGLQCNF